MGGWHAAGKYIEGKKPWTHEAEFDIALPCTHFYFLSMYIFAVYFLSMYSCGPPSLHLIKCAWILCLMYGMIAQAVCNKRRSARQGTLSITDDVEQILA